MLLEKICQTPHITRYLPRLKDIRSRMCQEGTSFIITTTGKVRTLRTGGGGLVDQVEMMRVDTGEKVWVGPSVVMKEIIYTSTRSRDRPMYRE